MKRIILVQVEAVLLISLIGNAKSNALTYSYLYYNLRMLNVDSPQKGERNEFIS